MGPIWGWRDPGGPHVGPMNFVFWVPDACWLHPWALTIQLDIAEANIVFHFTNCRFVIHTPICDAISHTHNWHDFEERKHVFRTTPTRHSRWMPRKSHNYSYINSCLGVTLVVGQLPVFYPHWLTKNSGFYQRLAMQLAITSWNEALNLGNNTGLFVSPKSLWLWNHEKKIFSVTPLLIPK